jgi:glycine/D-amino acid oxidase-like deaminating enzyme
MAFAQHAMAAGARLFEHSPAVAIEAGVVRTPQGKVRASHVIVASDGNLAGVLSEATPSVRQVRLQMVATAPTATRVELPVYARWGYDYWQQRPDGCVVIGGGRDLMSGSEDTGEQVSTETARTYLRGLLDQLGVHEPITHAWAGIVSYSNSGSPWIAQPREGVFGIGGYCGTGNVVGTLLGRSVVDYIATRSSDVLADFGYVT